MATDRTCAELDLRLFRVHHGAPQAEMRFHDGDLEQAVPRDPVFAITAISVAGMLQQQDGLEDYGRALAQQLFDDPNLREEFCQARRNAEQSGRELRLLLTIDSSAADLQQLSWEAVWDPHADGPWCRCSGLLLSRLVLRQNWRLVRLRRRTRLQIVAARALPPDLDRYGFDCATCKREEAAWQALRQLPLSLLEDPLTSDSLGNLLRRGCDILHLAVVVRSDRRSRHPHLLMSDGAGEKFYLSARELGRWLREVSTPPRLVVLSPAISAGFGETSELSSLAPWIVESGVASVVVLEEGLDAGCRERLLGQLLEKLLQHGRVECSVNESGRSLESVAEASRVRLFSSSRAPRLWYEPAFIELPGRKVKWPSLVASTRSLKLTPILGWGLGERVYGTSRDLAFHMAGNSLPSALHQRGDLPRVSQLVEIVHTAKQPLREMQEQMAQGILDRYRHLLGPSAENASLAHLLRESGRLLRRRDDDPYKLLAELPCPVYVSASADNLLREALVAAGKKPEVVFPKWRPNQIALAHEREPTVEEPLIYHIFGYFGDADSLVLTEDDYFEYLIRCGYEDLPAVVRHALADSSLMFLGFCTADWSFRVLYRLIRNLEGGIRRNRHRHVAVAVDPEGELLPDVAEARRYLLQYYEKSEINLFWGRGEDFLQELVKQWRQGVEPVQTEVVL